MRTRPVRRGGLGSSRGNYARGLSNNRFPRGGSSYPRQRRGYSAPVVVHRERKKPIVDDWKSQDDTHGFDLRENSRRHVSFVSGVSSDSEVGSEAMQEDIRTMGGDPHLDRLAESARRAHVESTLVHVPIIRTKRSSRVEKMTSEDPERFRVVSEVSRPSISLTRPDSRSSKRTIQSLEDTHMSEEESNLLGSTAQRDSTSVDVGSQPPLALSVPSNGSLLNFASTPTECAVSVSSAAPGSWCEDHSSPRDGEMSTISNDRDRIQLPVISRKPPASDSPSSGRGLSHEFVRGIRQEVDRIVQQTGLPTSSSIEKSRRSRRRNEANRSRMQFLRRCISSLTFLDSDASFCSLFSSSYRSALQRDLQFTS